MAVKASEILAQFDKQKQATPEKNGTPSAADILSAFDNNVKKKDGGENSGETSGATSPSISPSNSFLRSQQGATPLQSNFKDEGEKNVEDWSGIEAALKNKRDKYNAIEDAKNTKIQSTASPGGGYVPSSSLGDNLVDNATKDYETASKNTDAVLKQSSEKINKPIKELLDTGKYKDFFDAQGNFKYGEASQYIDGIVKKNGGGGYLRDQMVVALKQAGQYKLDEPLREKFRDEEYKKSGIDISKYGKDVFEKATAVKRGNLDLLEQETKQKSTAILNTNFKPQADSLGVEYNNKVQDLNEQVKNGQIAPDIAQQQIQQSYKDYTAKMAALNKHYQDSVRKINIDAQSKFARIDKELKSVAASITGDDVMKAIPDDVKKKMYDADARVEARIQKSKNDAKKAEDAATGAATGNFFGGLLTKGVINGWYNGVANIGQYLAMKGYDNGLTDYLKSKEYNAAVFAPAQYEYGKGENMERIVSGTGQSLGASAPIMIPAIGVSIASGGLGAPEVATSIATGLTSYWGEKSQNTGDVYRQMLEKTGDSNKAYEAAARYEQKQVVMLPLYFMEGAGIQNLIKGKGLKQLAIGQAQELAQELPTEYWQNYTQAQETDDYKGGFGQYIKENPATAIDVITSTLGQGAIMSAGGKIFQKINAAIPQAQSQYVTDMVSKQGAAFALENLQKQFHTGVIDEKEFNDGRATIERATQKLGDLAQVGIKGDDAKNFIVLSDTANQLADNATKTKDEGLKIVYEQKLEEVKQQMEAAAGGQHQYAVFTMPGGTDATKVVPIAQIESMKKSGMLDQLIHMSNGIEVKGNEALQKELQARKQELGNPANAPEGMYNDIEEKDADEKPTEAQRPIIDRVKEYGGEGIQRTIEAHEAEGKHTEAMQFLKDQSLDAPNALKKQLGMRKNLTTDIIAESSPTEIDEALRKQEEKLMKELKNKSENKDPRVLKEIEQHINLLEEGLAKAHERLSPAEKTEQKTAEPVEEDKSKLQEDVDKNNQEALGRIETERQDQVFKAHKPSLNMEFINSKDLVKSDDPMANKEENDKIREKFTDLQKLIDCLWS